MTRRASVHCSKSRQRRRDRKRFHRCVVHNWLAGEGQVKPGVNDDAAYPLKKEKRKYSVVVEEGEEEEECASAAAQTKAVPPSPPLVDEYLAQGADGIRILSPTYRNPFSSRNEVYSAMKRHKRLKNYAHRAARRSSSLDSSNQPRNAVLTDPW